ncbi:MAG: ATP-binding cassette domain-containing protein [Clostridiales Family XIII bacterium]|jgi:alpha-D-ribose 1-methylphosphonate 5-triphosphate synthase subunit PhnL|nr:ATP-binding cassette domain-containing protein [Clostridiales Family XIII bacterium]
MEILRVSDLGKDFYLHEPGLEIKSCHNINLTLRRGEFIGIVGLSGAGKSTILKCINRSCLPTRGEIWYDSALFGKINLVSASEREILYLRRHEIGYVSQFLNVMPRTTAKAHVMNALLLSAADMKTAEADAKEMLSYFRLPENLWNLYPATFSGGERLRLNLAHAMVKKPRLLLLDEPTAALDNKTKRLVRDILQKLKGPDTGMIGIFHDIAFMEGVCDQVFNISNGAFAS